MITIVKIKLLGHTKSFTGSAELEIVLAEPKSLKQFLAELSEKYPKLRVVVEEVLTFHGEYLLLLNDIDVGVYGDLDKVVIRDGDTLTVVPIVHGGAGS